MQLGAWGFVPKTMNVNSLHSVLDLVNNGQKFLPSGLRDGAGSDSSEFTGREVMILKAIAEGETNKDIARSIGTSEGNVKAIVRSICIRIGAKNRAHAVKLALEASVI
jgi:two-component system nitrate/nitrite response regulator NarP